MPARFSWASSSLKPNGSMRCNTDFVAAHKRATLPVFGGISGSTRTMFMQREFWMQDPASGGHSIGFRPDRRLTLTRPWIGSRLPASAVMYFPQYQAMGRG